MDPNIAVTFDGQNSVAFTQGEDRTFLLSFINRTDGAPINITGAVVGVNFPQASGGVVKRLNGPVTLLAADVVPAAGITRFGHGLVTGDPVVLAGAALPAPLAAATPYLIKVVDANTFGFAATDGTAIPLTSAGTGTFTMENTADVVLTSATAGLATLNLRSLVTAAIAAGTAQDFQVSVLISGKVRVVVVKNNLDVTRQPDP